MCPTMIELENSNSRRNINATAGLCLVLIAGVIGCGEQQDGAAKQLPTLRVKGLVTYKGTPVDDATISFHPVTAGNPGAVGKSNSAGEFSLRTYKAGDGAPEGEYQVSVQKSEIGGIEQKSGAEMFKDMEKQAQSGHQAVVERPLSLIPEKYARPQTSGLSAKVEANGTNEFTFELKD